MVEKRKKINETLGELLIGILVFGAAVQVTGLFLTKDYVFFSTGLWSGIAVSCFMAVHIYHSVKNAVEMQGNAGTTYLRNHVLIRYGIVVTVLVVLYFSKLGNPVVYCVGVLGLKIAAYMQPFFHRFRKKSESTNYDSSNKDEEVNI